MAEGTITRKDIIQDDAINWGSDYAKVMDLAIGKNKEFADGIMALNEANNKLRGSLNQKEFIENQRRLNDENTKTIGIWKEQNQLELALISTKKKNELATESTNKALVKERLELALVNKQVKQEALERLGLVGAYEKLNKSRTDAKNKLRDLMVTEGASIEQIKKAEKEYEVLNKKVLAADRAVGDFSKNVGNYPFQNLASGLKNLVAAFGVTAGIAAFGGILKSAYNEMKVFEQGVADLKAITGATGKDLEYLKSQAIETGKGVKGGAVAVVEAYKLIASAKPELLENVQDLNAVTKAVLTLAQASGMEMPIAATKLTDAMNQFNAPASEATRFIDALANGAKYGAAEIPDITDAMLKFGAVARSTNISVEESTALIELLAENGIKGADAGTALRNVLLKLNAPDALPKKAQQALNDLGISFDVLKDKTIPIQQKLELLKPLLNDNAAMVKIFGLENVVAAQNIIGHTERLKALTSKMDEYGTAQEQARIETDTLQGDTDKLASTYDSLVLSLNKGSGVVTGFFRFFIDGAKGALEGLIRLNSSWAEINDKAANKGRELGEEEFEKRIRSAGFLTSTDAEKAKMVLEKAEAEYSDLLKRKNKNNKEIADFNPYALNFGKSGKDMKKEQEQLILDITAREAIIRKAKERLNKLKSTTTKGDNGKTVDGTGAETKDDAKAREKALRDKLAAEKKLNDDLYELQKQRLERQINLNNEVAKDEEETDDVRIAAALNSQKKQVELAELTKKHSLDADKFVLDKDKLSSNEKIRIKEEAANKIVDIEKKTVEEIDKIKVFDEAKYQKELEDKVSKLNVAQNAELEAENKRFAELGDLEALSLMDRENAIEDHEKRVYEIKKKYAIDALKLQIKNLETELAASDALPANEQISADKRQKIAETLSKAKLDLSEVEVSTNKKNNDKEVLTEREKTEMILEMSSALSGALTDLGNAVFERKIQNIEEEIAKNDEYYNKQIELAGNDERQKTLLQKEREKKNEELEKKKRKEQHKQAVFNKATALAQAGISTALAILNGLNTMPFLPMGPAMAILAGVLGAVQIGAIIATPIPKYKDGRKGGKAETAWVGDGGVSEVITSSRGLNPRLTPNIPTLTHLNQGDIVHKSIGDYQAYMRASVLNGFKNDGRIMNDFQALQNEEKYGKEMLEELKRNTEAIKRQKNGSVINMPGFDINHHLWKMGNTNW